MNRLLQFLFKYRTLLVFVFLEGICFWVIVKSNSYHSAEFFTSSNQMAASVLESSSNVRGYFSLTEQNKILAEENARLRQLLLQMPDSVWADSLLADSTQSPIGITANVVDNSIFYRNNYLTINKGSEDGVHEKMGVIGPDGIVGQVKHISSHYSTVVSLLHSRSMISAMHANSKGLCTITWKGEDPQYAEIEYFPRHILLNVGDTIVTSGYNSVFPEGQMIGIVSKIHLDEAATFYDAQLKLATDFYTLKDVYLMSLPDKNEIDSLTYSTMEEDGQI
ncbi:rod shape-determining protein MreC [Reichenbachiella agarivorans]|uniref:Cell shape-determining protein MreC n=1 Tax=Reichenbachiella agarivorans TaxID=2979464 RepID=A0ABY6CSZ9_9BACT|nr:rod shape-determining protein MreC [Reichenbachiella agarivorans]UXP33631.1 rod shape-determining protein MreC [Reichenbachiella agarivorans]